MNFNKKTWNEQSYRELLVFLKENADEKYRDFHSKIAKSQSELIGIRIPDLKSIAKEIAKGNYAEFLSLEKGSYFEESMLHGLVLGYAKMDLTEFRGYVEKFVPMIENWSVCDSCVANFRIIKKNRAEYLEFLKNYFLSEEEFALRFAFVCLIDFYVDEEYLDFIFTECDRCKSEYYYVKMAVAWLISVCYVKFPQKTDIYLKDNSLDDWTYNKALQKICESYRATDEQKEYIRKLKRK